MVRSRVYVVVIPPGRRCRIRTTADLLLLTSKDCLACGNSTPAVANQHRAIHYYPPIVPESLGNVRLGGQVRNCDEDVVDVLDGYRFSLKETFLSRARSSSDHSLQLASSGGISSRSIENVCVAKSI